jgi:hypothetical protein
MPTCLPARFICQTGTDVDEILHRLITPLSRGSSGSIVSDYGLDDRGWIPTGAEDFFSSP